jgi:ribosomal protein S18 acetylase RimI-like enzyme
VKKSKHLLFDLYNFDFFRKSERGEAIMLFGESKFLTTLIAVPYLVGCELAFFREERYFVRLNERTAAVFVLREKPDTLFVVSLAVAPQYRRHGLATQILNYSEKVARRMGKSWLELTVLKKNISARNLYEKAGFTKKEERKWSLVLRKSVNTKSL